MIKTGTKIGFSLIELLVCIASAAIAVLLVALILSMAFRAWRTNNAFAELRRDSAFATLMIEQDVREASFDGLSATANSLRVDSAVTNKTVIFSHTGDQLVYRHGSYTNVLIREGLRSFGTVKTNDGIKLSLVVVNTNYAIAQTNQIFINTRN